MVITPMETVLLLNASYEPLQTISVQRAVNLILAEKALAVEGVARRLRSVYQVFEVPSVLRLTYYVNAPQKGAIWSRKAVLERDRWTCVYCGIRPGRRHKGMFFHRADFTIDHILPRSRGGGNTWGNTACACAPCNQRKADRMPHEAGMKMRFEPKTPRGRVLIIQGHIPREWKKYLDF
jgi:5-methylcytosine-specific restriction endonuclease McrA